MMDSIYLTYLYLYMPEFHLDLVNFMFTLCIYKETLVGTIFLQPLHFFISHFKRLAIACLVVNPIIVEDFVFLLSSTPVC